MDLLRLMLLFLPIAFSVSERPPVTLTSSLKQGLLCPGDSTATFICVSVGREIVWNVWNGNSLDYVYAFFEDGHAGERAESNGHIANLIKKTNTSSLGEFEFHSILYMTLHSEDIRKRVQVSCHNHRPNSVQFYEIASNTSKPPPADVLAASTLMTGGDVPKVSLNISWSQYGHSIDHYVVQVDSHPPYHVSAQNTTAHFVMDLSSFSEDTLPVVRVSAVDVCGQASNTSVGVVKGYSELFSHTTIESVQQTTVTEQPSTGLSKKEKVHVKCNQTGKTFKAKITALSKENAEPISAADLAKGSQLFLDINDKSYPVTVIKVVQGEAKSNSKAKKRRSCGYTLDISTPQPVEVEVLTSLTDDKSSPEKKELKKVLDAKQSFDDSETVPSCSSQISTPRAHAGSSRDLLLKMNTTLNTILDLTKKLVTDKGSVKQEEDPKYTVNGINLLMIPARDAYAYGRNLLDVLFDKEILAQSVVVKSSKSKKPPLDTELVQLIFDCVKLRYPDYNHQKMMTSLGQKCRDSRNRE